MKDRTSPVFPSNRPIEPEQVSRPNPPEINLQLAPHLRELCTILAAGLVRLRRRTAEDFAADAARFESHGEISLRPVAHQSGHADEHRRRPA